MYSQTIAAADPTPFRRPRFIRWPSVCDTSRTNWLNPSAESYPPAPLRAAEACTIDVGCHMNIPPLAPGEPMPAYLLNIETICTPVATADQQAAFAKHTFSTDSVPSPLPPNLRDNLYSTTICGPGIPATPFPQTESQRPAGRKIRHKKIGRPTAFDEAARARFCGMIDSGCTIRYSAKRLGINRRTVRYACLKDPAFADRLRAAEQQRDLAAVGRIHNAGEKSWRAAAWLLERIAPQEFCLRRGPTKQSLQRQLGKRKFKKLVAEVAKQLPQAQQPSAASDFESHKPKPRQMTTDVIEGKINEILLPLSPDERFNLMYRLGF